MKIVQINAVAEYSSTGRTTSELHNELIKRGISSWIAAPNVEDSVSTIKIGSRFENKWHSLYSRLTGRQGYASRAATKRLVRRLREIKPDVIHLRNLHANYINLHLLGQYLLESKTPCVITLHDCWPFTGHCCYFIDSNCERWKSGCGGCPDLRNWNKSWFFDRSKQNLSGKAVLWHSISRLAVIGVSDWVTGFIKDSILKDSYIVRRIYNWIDLNTFRYQSNAKYEIRKRHNLSSRPIILGVSQVWNRQKGLYDFVELAKLMPECNFLLIGKVIENAKLPLNILSVGTTSDVAELVKYYSAADVFFNPSTRETFGKVTAESLACSTPIVAYNATATPELVGKGCGHIISSFDISAAKIAITAIINGPSLRQSCRSFAEATFDKPTLVNDYISVYKQLIN